MFHNHGYDVLDCTSLYNKDLEYYPLCSCSVSFYMLVHCYAQKHEIIVTTDIIICNNNVRYDVYLLNKDYLETCLFLSQLVGQLAQRHQANQQPRCSTNQSAQHMIKQILITTCCLDAVSSCFYEQHLSEEPGVFVPSPLTAHDSAGSRTLCGSAQHLLTSPT